MRNLIKMAQSSLLYKRLLYTITMYAHKYRRLFLQVSFFFYTNFIHLLKKIMGSTIEYKYNLVNV